MSANRTAPMIGHSAAPWSAEKGEVVDATGEVVGVVFRAEGWNSGEPVTSDAQASLRLITAAPKLLAALRSANHVREMQRSYFKNRNIYSLEASKKAEKEFDRLAAAAFIAATGEAP